MMVGMPPCASGMGNAQGSCEHLRVARDIALLNQLPQFGVHHVAVFEPRADQCAMAAAMSGKPLRHALSVGDHCRQSKLRRAVGIDLVAGPRAVEMRDMPMGCSALPAWARPIPSGCRPAPAGRAATWPASPSISARRRRRCRASHRPRSGWSALRGKPQCPSRH